MTSITANDVATMIFPQIKPKQGKITMVALDRAQRQRASPQGDLGGTKWVLASSATLRVAAAATEMACSGGEASRGNDYALDCDGGSEPVANLANRCAHEHLQATGVLRVPPAWC